MAVRVRNNETGETGTLQMIGGEQRFIPDTVDPAEDVGAIEAGLIQAGRSFLDLGSGIRALAGQERGFQELSEREALTETLSEERPVASFIGEALPTAAVPGGLGVQIGAGAAEGAIRSPSDPGMGAIIGAAGSFLGQRLGDEFAAALTRRTQRMSQSASRRALGEAVETTAGLEGNFSRVMRGAPISVGERTGSRTAQIAELAADTVRGGSRVANRRQANLNRAVARGLGVDADALTGNVLDQSARQIGDLFEGVAKGVDEIPLTERASELITNLEIDAQQLVPNERAMRQLDRLTDFMVEGRMNGQQYIRLRSEMAKISRAEWKPGGDQISGEFVDDIIHSLDEIFTEAAPEFMAPLQEARGRWKFLSAVRRGASVSPTGDVNPNSLMRSLESSYQGLDLNRFARGDIGGAQQAVQAAQQFPRAASSGTAERLTSLNPLRQGMAAIINAGGGAGGQLGGALGRRTALETMDDADRDDRP